MFKISFLILSLLGAVYAETGVNCCPGIAFKPVRLETCASGAEHGSMCIGNFFQDCECVTYSYEIDGFIYCGKCRGSLSGGIIIIILLIVGLCIGYCCYRFFCCRKGKKFRTVYIDTKFGKKTSTSPYGVSSDGHLVELEE